LLARISTDGQFQFGIRPFLADLNPSNRNASTWPYPSHRRIPLLSPLDRVGVDVAVPMLGADVVGS